MTALSLSADGRELWLRPFNREANGASPLDEPFQRWDWRTGRRLPDPPPADPDATLAESDDGLTLWRRKADRVAELRVTAADGTPQADWAAVEPFPGEPWSSDFLPGTATAALLSSDDVPGWADWPPLPGPWSAAERKTLSVLDGRTGRVRVVRDYWFSPAGGSVYLAVTRHRLTVAVCDWRTGRAWAEVWPSPPRPAPAWWAWPVAVAGGATAGRLFRRRVTTSPRAETASTGSS